MLLVNSQPTTLHAMVATATTTFLSKPSELNVLGLHTSADGNQVLLTIQDDGVVAYDVAKQVQCLAMMRCVVVLCCWYGACLGTDMCGDLSDAPSHCV